MFRILLWCICTEGYSTCSVNYSFCLTTVYWLLHLLQWFQLSTSKIIHNDQPKQLVVQFLTKAAKEVRTTELQAFGNTVTEIAGTTEVNCKLLLTAKPINLFYSEDGTIDSINREHAV